MEGNHNRGHKKWLILLLLLGGVGVFAYLLPRNESAHPKKPAQIQVETPESETGKKATVKKTVTTSKVISREEETTVFPDAGLLARIFKYFNDKIDDLKRNQSDKSNQAIDDDLEGVGQPNGPHYGHPQDWPNRPPTYEQPFNRPHPSVDSPQRKKSPKENLSLVPAPKTDKKSPKDASRPKNHISSLKDFPTNKSVTVPMSDGKSLTYQSNPPQNLAALDTKLGASGINKPSDKLTTGDYIALFGPRVLNGIFDLSELYLAPSPDRPTSSITTVEPKDGIDKMADGRRSTDENQFRVKRAIQEQPGTVESTITYDTVTLNHCIESWSALLSPPDSGAIAGDPDELATQACQRTLAIYDPESAISK